MAVEIPVIVDIDGAFKDAASRVATAIKPLQNAVDQNIVKIRVDNTSIQEASEELQELNEWYRALEKAEWSGPKIDLGPTINRAIFQLRDLERQINEIQDLRWSEGGQGDFSFATEYKRLRDEIQKTIKDVVALEQTQEKMVAASGINFREYIENIDKTDFELLQMREHYKNLGEESDKWARAVNPAVVEHV